jgi:hypothetical protein
VSNYRREVQGHILHIVDYPDLGRALPYLTFRLTTCPGITFHHAVSLSDLYLPVLANGSAKYEARILRLEQESDIRVRRFTLDSEDSLNV